jgi:hypothetical protein
MSRLNKGNGNGRSGGLSGTGGSSPPPKGPEPDSGLERTLRRLLKKLPEGYSASIQKTGKVALVCTDSQMEKLETHSKLRIYVVRQKNGDLKATVVTAIA